MMCPGLRTMRLLSLWLSMAWLTQEVTEARAPGELILQELGPAQGGAGDLGLQELDPQESGGLCT